MILDIVKKYKPIIKTFAIQKFKKVRNAYQLMCKISFVNHSELYIKDYLFLDGTRKYSFHWQNDRKECIIRWDNAPHHQNKVSTFPFHQHMGKDEIIVESKPMRIENIFNYIHSEIT